MTRSRSTAGPAVAKAVERQMRNWELGRAQRVDTPDPKRRAVEPFITLSRSVGADGGEIAALLGRELDWPVFDKELLDAMAGDDAVRRRIYASMDERDVGWCEEALRSLVAGQFARNDYFHRLTETVLSLARQGRGIFLGRGADLILPRGVGLRVRLIAPRAACVERFAREHDLDRDEAAADVERRENERDEFIRRHFHVDPNDPARYDLTINLERFASRSVVSTILTARTMAG